VTVQKRLSQIGFAKQTVKGTQRRVPAYVVGLTGGSVYDRPTITENDLNTTWTRPAAARPRAHRGSAGQARLTSSCTPATIGLLLYAGARCRRDHRRVRPVHAHHHARRPRCRGTPCSARTAPTSPPSSTARSTPSSCRGKRRARSRPRSSRWACVLTFASTWTGGTAESVAGNTFRGQGGVFTVAGATARVVSGSIKIDNGLQRRSSRPTRPRRTRSPKSMVKCDLSLTIVPDDLLLFRTVVTGSASSGTTAQAVPQYGACRPQVHQHGAGPRPRVRRREHEVRRQDARRRPGRRRRRAALEGSVAGAFTFLLRNAVATAY
jgi:hypothetical protein